MNQARGVRWRYLDPEAVNVHCRRHAHRCEDCGRWFEASVYREHAGRYWCPECKPVESVAYSVREVLAETERRPVLVDVEDLFSGSRAKGQAGGNTEQMKQ